MRCAASLRDGTVTASLLVARLQAAGGKLPLTRALQEYGRLVKTRFVLGYLADETERRAIGRQQNKGESLHALHGRTFHGNHGTVRLYTLERQSTQARCLHLVANAIVYWNTIYIQRALDDLGHEPDSDELDGPGLGATRQAGNLGGLRDPARHRCRTRIVALSSCLSWPPRRLYRRERIDSSPT